jgi:hypothetical protein
MKEFDPLEYRIGTLEQMDRGFDSHSKAYKRLFGRKRTKEMRQSVKGLIELYQETQHGTNS